MSQVKLVFKIYLSIVRTKNYSVCICPSGPPSLCLPVSVRPSGPLSLSLSHIQGQVCMPLTDMDLNLKESSTPLIDIPFFRENAFKAKQ